MDMDERIFRRRARENLAGNWSLSLGTAAVAALLGALTVGGSFLPDVKYIAQIPVLHDYVQRFYPRLSFGSGVFRFQLVPLGLAVFLLGGVLQLGYARFLLNQYDRRTPAFGDLFSQFDRFGTGFAQAFLVKLYTFLWSLLFVIPGIIAVYRYAMTPFILAEHPELTASEAIRRSKQMMDGHKEALFLLDLSYLGWVLLAVLTLNIGNLWLNPYLNAARAAFYRELQPAASSTAS